MELGNKPKLLMGKVMHKRLFPRVNAFTYNMYYLSFPLSQLKQLARGWRFGLNKFAPMSFHEKDHGKRDGSDLKQWAREILDQYGVSKADGEITLIALPRIFGYVFNPVSFWLCHDKAGGLRAVICEVNNTFGETHSYLCAHHDHRVITNDDWLEGKKLFHVSPFMQRKGLYKFRFAFNGDKAGIWIDYYDEERRKKLLTAVTGKYVEFNEKNLRRAFWKYPLITLKTIMLIHWQALKLMAKRIQYVPKPVQKNEKISATKDLNP